MRGNDRTQAVKIDSAAKTLNVAYWANLRPFTAVRSTPLSLHSRPVAQASPPGPTYLDVTLKRDLENTRRQIMGDKSPKAMNRHKKQDAANKNQKKAAAIAKSNPTPAESLKKKGK